MNIDIHENEIMSLSFGNDEKMSSLTI